jgi:hypothetical protein
MALWKGAERTPAHDRSRRMIGGDGSNWRELDVSGLIVVGVDGSESARFAAQWAAREARLRNAAVRLVSAWDLPTYGFGLGAVGISDNMMKAVQRPRRTTSRMRRKRSVRSRRRSTSRPRSLRVKRLASCSKRPGTPTSSWLDHGDSGASVSCSSAP